MVKLPFGVFINNLIDDLRILSWEACDSLLYYSQMLRDPNNKSNIVRNIDDPVTLADLKVNEIIIQGINEKYKDINWEILSEENVKVSSQICDINSDWLWILDPLDGTKDFIQGTGNYAMHLALNYKQKPYIGVVLIPEKEELWIAAGNKIWCENKVGHKRGASLLSNTILKEMTIATSKNHRNVVLEKLINLLKFKNITVMGSVGCKIASILRGESDIYISLSLPGKSAPKDWDFAAPAAILVAAGGAITNLDNENLSFNQRGFEQGGIIIASSNKNNHREVCLQVKEIIKESNIYHLIY